MADVSTLSTSLKLAELQAQNALELTSTQEQDEVKVVLKDLRMTLIDAKSQAADLRLDLLVKQEIIQTLTQKLASKSKLVRHNELYFEAGKHGAPVGDPLCPRCFDAANLRVFLVHSNKHRVVCNNCDKDYPRKPNKSDEGSGNDYMGYDVV